MTVCERCQWKTLGVGALLMPKAKTKPRRREDQLTVILYSLTVKKPDGSKANINVSCVLLICASTYWETKPTDVN